MNKILIVISLSLVLCKTYVYSDQPPSKIQPQMISIHELIDIKTSNRRIALIDVDAPQTYNNEHIDGAINIPLEEITQGNLPKLKFLNDHTAIITYCHCGSEATRARKAADQLALILKTSKIKYLGSPPNAFYEYKKSGYPVAVNLKKYIPLDNIYTATGEQIASQQLVAPPAGQQPLSSRTITSEILNSRITNHPEEIGKNFLIIDLRESEEYETSHIPYAQNIPLGRLLSKTHDGKFYYEKILPQDKEIFLYCQGGLRTRIAIDEISKNPSSVNYKIYLVEKGFDNWKSAGYKTESPQVSK